MQTNDNSSQFKDSVGEDFPANAILKPGWILTLQDEFSEKSLDETVWIPYYFRHRFEDKHAQATYEIKDGALYLLIKKGGNKVSSIQTFERRDLHKPGYRKDIPTSNLFLQKYGYFEIRAKTQGGSGHNSAFWLVGSQKKKNQNAEIDILEHAGNFGNYAYQTNVHIWSDKRLRRKAKKLAKESQTKHLSNRDISNSFNIYAAEWDENQIKFFFNNELVGIIPYSPNYEMGLLLSLYEGDGWYGKVDKFTEYPKKFVVDYIRVYTRGELTNKK